MRVRVRADTNGAKAMQKHCVRVGMRVRVRADTDGARAMDQPCGPLAVVRGRSARRNDSLRKA